MDQARFHGHQDENSKKLCISLVPIFNHLKEEEMLEIVKTSRDKKYQKGQLIFQAGSSSEHLYIVHKGRVKIYRLGESGKEQLLRILEPGDFMGELSLFTKETLTSFAEAMEETEICSIHQSDLKDILLSKPVISLKILEEFSKRLNETEKIIERLSSQDAEKRLASYLIELSYGIADAGATEITLPMSKRDLASYIGMTQETLSRRLSSFQDNGWIKQSGQRKIFILDRESILERAES